MIFSTTRFVRLAPSIRRTSSRRERRRSVATRGASGRLRRRVCIRATAPKTVKVAPAVTPPPRLVPFSDREATEPSGQNAHALFESPLCGRPRPLGAHYDASLARNGSHVTSFIVWMHVGCRQLCDLQLQCRTSIACALLRYRSRERDTADGNRIRSAAQSHRRCLAHCVARSSQKEAPLRSVTSHAS